MKPIKLLQQELNKLLSAKQHSIDALKIGKIDIELYEEHMRNLIPLIASYHYAIRILTIYPEANG